MRLRLPRLLACLLAAASVSAALGAQPSRAANPCPDGTLRCVQQTIGTMQDTYDALASQCDHNAVFALSYWRTTQAYATANATPGWFDDPAWVNREDWYFGRLWLDARTDWLQGKKARVPQAWQIAFASADAEQVSGAGDLLLGMNAHVNRDLPFALEAMGLVAPDETSRKHDHDAINPMLSAVMPSILTEAAARLDPTIPAALINLLPLTDLTFFQLLALWREQAWQNAVRLVNARTPAQHAQVAASIEQSAATEAVLIRTVFAYLPLLGGAARRDAYCAAHAAP
jgi:Family of unknown function (DUF5995)